MSNHITPELRILARRFADIFGIPRRANPNLPLPEDGIERWVTQAVNVWNPSLPDLDTPEKRVAELSAYFEERIRRSAQGRIVGNAELRGRPLADGPA